nr:NADPH-dependent glutamate synthase [Candidatus Sigynarchaeota archaeon]
MGETIKAPKIPRQVLSCLDPKERIKNFNEVATGFTEEQAIVEAKRCLKCKKQPCTTGCPVEIDIKSFLEKVADRKFKEALEIIKEKNNLPAITGRVCPQESQCEAQCTLGKAKGGQPAAIGAVERFVADWCSKNKVKIKVNKLPPNNIKAGIIGSGPAGLTAAGDLARLGFEVTVLEAFQEAGGVLLFGIPEFRLPKRILQEEVAYLKELGVKFEVDTVVGKSIDVEELFDAGFKTIFMGTGAGLPMFLKIKGENLRDVYSANEFLTRVNLMKAYKFPEYDTPIKIGSTVLVVGGGNVALDSARTALRLGAKEAYIVYRRTLAEMPARQAEVDHAKEEGVIFKWLRSPVEIIGDEKKNVTAMKFQEMTLGCLDESGRAACLPVEGAYETITASTVIIAVGNETNTICSSSTCGLEVDKKGHVKVNPETQESTIEGLFAGGDAVTGSATVISAMGAAKKAAKHMAVYATKK